MVRHATSVLAISLLTLPVLVVSSEQYERRVAESDLYGRDLADLEDIILTREDLDEIFGREFVTDIDERSPGFGTLFRGGAKVLGKLGRKGAQHMHSAQHSHSGHRAHSVIKGMNNINDAYGQASQFNGGSNNNNRREFDEEEFDLRDFDEDLDTREPINIGMLRKIFHHAHKAEVAAEYIPQPNNNNNNNNNNNRRDTDEDLFGREFDEEEFFAREYFDDLD
jgi:hypothetical protein